MKNIELSIKRGDRVWVKVYNERNGSFTSPMDAFLMNKSLKYAMNLFLNSRPFDRYRFYLFEPIQI